MNLVLIRHSKSLVNPNIPIMTWGLSKEGVALAEKLNGISQIKSLDVLYSSLQTKALETAILATKDTGIPIKTDNRLTESTSFTNKFISSKLLNQNTRNYYSDKGLSFNNGETFEETRVRFNLAIESITKEESGKMNVGIVSHGNILTAFVSQFVNKDTYELHESMRYPDFAVLDWKTKKFITFFGDVLIG